MNIHVLFDPTITLNMRARRGVSVQRVFQHGRLLYQKTLDAQLYKDQRGFLMVQSLLAEPCVVKISGSLQQDQQQLVFCTADAGLRVLDWANLLPVGHRHATHAVLFEVSQFLQLIAATLNALLRIHEHQVVHLDIKNDNICIPYQQHGQHYQLDFSRLQLIDFETAVSVKFPHQQPLPIQSTYYHVQRLKDALDTKNVVLQSDMDYGADLFALGMMLYRLLNPTLSIEQLSAAANRDRTLDLSAERLAWSPQHQPTQQQQVMQQLHALISTLLSFNHTPCRQTHLHRQLLEQIEQMRCVLYPDRSDWPPYQVVLDMQQPLLWDSYLQISPTPIQVEPTRVDHAAAPTKKLPTLSPSLLGATLPISLTPTPMPHVPPASPRPRWRQWVVLLGVVAGLGVGGAVWWWPTAQPSVAAAAATVAPAQPAAVSWTAIEQEYLQLRQGLYASSWISDSRQPRPAEWAQFWQLNTQLADHLDRGAMLDRAFFLAEGLGVDQDRRQAEQLIKRVLARSMTARDTTYRQAALELADAYHFGQSSQE